MTITIRPATTKERVLQYGTVACSLFNDIRNPPYLQAIASISLLIMETAQRLGRLAILLLAQDRAGRYRPRQVRWTRSFLQTLNRLPADAARSTFLDISDVAPDDPDLGPLLALTENMPGMITRIAFEGCTSLVVRWEKEGPTRLCETEIHVHASDTDAHSPTPQIPVPIVEPPALAAARTQPRDGEAAPLVPRPPPPDANPLYHLISKSRTISIASSQAKS
ncbi:hypothetical protein C8J57DRAFT_1734669 [Mycena rebaudengoi]|nr:hypothetical protein C8J57DRAFT_1734669 [Mycena rebaudengoi]